jgi:two-component system, cell cycle response regulator
MTEMQIPGERRGLGGVSADPGREGEPSVPSFPDVKSTMHEKKIRLLLVEDNEADARFVHELLDMSGDVSFSVILEERLSSAVQRLASEQFDLVLLDLTLPDEQGINTFIRLHNAFQDVPIVVMSAIGGEEFAMAAVNRGAQDYLVKGTVDTNLLIRSIRYAIERKRAEKMLIQAAREWRTTFDALENAVILTENEGRILRCNRAASEFFRKPFTEIIGHQLWDFLRSDASSVRERFNDMKKTNRRTNMVLRSDGKWFSINFDPILDEKGRLAGGACIFSDITPQRQTEDELRMVQDGLRRLAVTDELTGAFNRSKFEEIIHIEMERANRYGDPLSLIIFDIDHFKAVNDTYGHTSGDKVLRRIADIVRENIRKMDYFIRWGGEEFMIISSELPLDRAYALAERLRKLTEQNSFNGIGRLSVSFGVTEFRAGEDDDSFVRRADTALYHAKRKGRNRVEVLI